MRILLVSSGTDRKDGWSVYTKTLAEGLRSKGDDVVLAEGLGAPLPYGINPLIALLNAGKLKKQIRMHNPDIIHFTVEPYIAMLPSLGKDIAAKTVLTIHGSYGVRMFQGSMNRRRACKVMRTIGACITVSEYTQQRVAEEIRKHCGEDVVTMFLDKNQVIKNGITLPSNIAQPENTVKHVLCVGAVKPRKGILESLIALSQYIKTVDTNVHMTIVGSYGKHDTYMQLLQNFIHEQSLNTAVTFTGELDDASLQDLYKKADLYLMPAKTTHDAFEGFGIVFIEAAGYGIPCIGTNDSGAAEAIEEGVSGFTCDPQDTDAIVKAMDIVLNEKTIDRNACRSWAEQHTATAMVDAIQSLYATLI